VDFPTFGNPTIPQLNPIAKTPFLPLATNGFLFYNNNMPYLWEEFNIKTFPAETIVFRDGAFVENLSDSPQTTLTDEHKAQITINKFSKLPVHIIYIGEITGKNEMICKISAENQQVFLTAKIKIKKPAFLNIFIENTGKNSVLNGKILIQNFSKTEIIEKAGHFVENTGIFLSNKIVAHSGSETKLSGVAEIAPKCEFCGSDINFKALAAPDAKIHFSPSQRIAAIPGNAAHSASIWRGSDAQIKYLREAGLGSIEIKQILEEAFLNDFV
jgi:hypothetical protein